MVLHSRVVTRDLPPQKLRSGQFSFSFTADQILHPECSFLTLRTWVLFLYFTSAVLKNFCKSWGRELHSQLPEDHGTMLVNWRGFGFVPSNPELSSSVIGSCGKYRLNFKCCTKKWPSKGK